MKLNQYFGFRKEKNSASNYVVSSHQAVPAFDYTEFLAVSRSRLLTLYPHPEHRDLITHLTPEPRNMALQLNSQKELLISSDVETVGWLMQEIFNNHKELWSPLMRTDGMGLGEPSLLNFLEQIELRFGDQRIDSISDLQRSLNSVFPEADTYNLTILPTQEAGMRQTTERFDEKTRLVRIEHSFVVGVLDTARQKRDIAAASLSTNSNSSLRTVNDRAGQSTASACEHSSPAVI